ncbi:response regulator [Desulfomarina sp.]
MPRPSEAICKKQVDLLYRQLPASLLTTAILSICMFFLLRNFPDQKALLGWLSLMMSVLLYRTCIFIFHTKINKTRPISNSRAELLFNIGAALTGITWGLLACWIYPMTVNAGSRQLILIVLVGIAGGSTATLSYQKLPVTLFVVLTLQPFTFGLYKTPDSQNVAIGIALIIYTLFLLKSARTLQQNYEQLLLLEEKAVTREKVLRKSQQQAEEASRSKSNFLANMSHEIRTPMNAIIGMTRLVQETELDPVQKKYVGRIETSSTMLLGLLNDILDFSKIEAGQLLLEEQPFLLETLLDNVYSTMIDLARDKKLTLVIRRDGNVPEAIIGDAVRLGQVLVNLIGNAIKFTDQGRISVHVSFDGTRSTEKKKILCFAVKDTGIGIPVDKQQHLFGSFQQADSSISRRYGGTGLGLAISRQLVQLMGGECVLTSTEGLGSTFSFTIPLVSCDKERVRQACQLSGGRRNRITGLAVLLVEDNETNRELATIILESSGQEVRAAENGLQALKLLSTYRFDVILMDVQMPEMDGLTTTRIIRAMEENRPVKSQLSTQLLTLLKKRLTGEHIPIIAMTAHAMDSDRTRCLKAGMDEYLTKPFQPEQVMELLQKFSAEKIDCQSTSNEPTSQTVEHSEAKENLRKRVQTHLSKTYKLQPDQIDQLLVTSARSMSEHLNKALAASNAEDDELLCATVHGLKGNLLNLGLQKHAQTAVMAEQRARAGEISSCHRLLISLQKSLVELLD